MKACELLEELKSLDPDLEVVLCDGGQVVSVAAAWSCYFGDKRVIKLDRDVLSLGGTHGLKAEL